MILKSTILTIMFSAFGLFFKTLPAVTVSTFEGKEVNIKDYTSNGKIQLVSLWATWCGPCKRELNALESVYPKWKEQYGVEIVAITLDNARSVKRAHTMALKEEWPYTFFSDPDGELAGGLGVRGIPYSMLIDQSGNIVSTSEGYYEGYEEEMEKKIKSLVQ